MTTLDISWLSSEQGQTIIKRASEFTDALQSNTALRKQFPEISTDLISQAITQANLRRNLSRRWQIETNKFLLTDDGINQATRPRVARYRAEWIKKQFGKSVRVLDMTCGLGFDSLAMAHAGLQVHAIEREEVTAECARHNLRATDVEVAIGDATQSDVAGFDVIFVDPARRNPNAPRRIDGTSSRIFNPQDWSPSWDFINSVAQQVPVVAKVAPGIEDTALIHWDAQWISDGGDVVEAMLTRFKSSSQGSRCAVLLNHDVEKSLTFTGNTDAPIDNSGKFLICPDGAITRAGALDVVAHLVDGGLVNEHIGWLTSSNEQAVVQLLAIDPQPADCFEIIGRNKCDAKEIAKAIKDVPASAITIMTRGVSVDVDVFRRRIAHSLDRHAPELVVALYREDCGNQAIIARRLTKAQLAH